MTMQRLIVDLKERSYPVIIGEKLMAQTSTWLPFIQGNQIYIVSEQQIAKHYLSTLLSGIPEHYQIEIEYITSGEESKSLAYCQTLFTALARMPAHRNVTIIALGGGVVGDLAGFVSACWMRGVSWIQIPTSLLAMVDASVGGKTAINLAEGKNLVGAFHQPRAVIIDVDTLHTLPTRQFNSGLSEVVKYAAISDVPFFTWIESHADELRTRNAEALSYVIAQCCQRKAQMVARDEFETGERALLNFGHTFGHALERLNELADLTHGEAVAIGMVLAARLSEQLGMSTREHTTRLINLLRQLQLPVEVPEKIPSVSLLQYMRRDKKNTNEKLRLILWRGIGKAEIINDIDEQCVLDVLQ
jgi:3-dehydroquinate synthase